jgi:hypothetical protein
MEGQHAWAKRLHYNYDNKVHTCDMQDLEYPLIKSRSAINDM